MTRSGKEGEGCREGEEKGREGGRKKREERGGREEGIATVEEGGGKGDGDDVWWWRVEEERGVKFILFICLVYLKCFQDVFKVCYCRFQKQNLVCEKLINLSKPVFSIYKIDRNRISCQTYFEPLI